MKTRTISIMSLAVALMGCASTQVTTDWDRTTDFAKYDTYAWMDTPRMRAMQQATLFDRRLRDAVEEQLAAKGLRQARTKSSADVLLVYDAGMQGKLAVRQSGYFGRQLDVTEYREGTLLIDVVDAQSNSLVWRATARAEIEDDDLSSEKIAKAVAKMFENFPGA